MKKSNWPMKSLALIPCLCAWIAAQDLPPPGPGTAAASAPTLKIDTAIYDAGPGVLQFAFTFANPSDSLLFLDCQLPPRAALDGRTLILRFDRSAPAGPPEATAGGPASGGSIDPADFPPQRIAGGRTFQGRRRLDRILGGTESRPVFDKLRLEMAYYPERTEGEGEGFATERMGTAVAGAAKVAQRGKRPPPGKRSGPR